jgi:hypothetical protein
LRVWPKQTLCGIAGKRVQPRALRGQHHRRRPPRAAVLARIDPVAQLGARGLELGEALVFAAQVVLGRDQIGPRYPDRRLRAALDSGSAGTQDATVTP